MNRQTGRLQGSSMMDKQTGRQTGRQEGRQVGRQETHRQTDRQVGTNAEGQGCRQAGWHRGRCTN